MPEIELRLFGAVDVRRHGESLRRVVMQPRRFALLTYLAMAGRDAAVRRDTLLSLFWPESDTTRARGALRNALHFLRDALGPEALPSSGTEDVAVNRARVWCDAVEVEELLDAGRRAEALGRYRGDLLLGFHVSEAPDFERWLDAERDRIRRRVFDAAMALSDEAERAGTADVASHYARAVVALAPTDERAAARLITLLARAGDRGGALRAFDELAARLAEELEIAPSAAIRALAEDVRTGRIAPRPSSLGGSAISAPADAPVTTPASNGAAAVPPPSVPATRKGRRWQIAGSAMVTILAMAAIMLSRQPASADALDPDILVVAPFRVSGSDSSNGYLREGMVDLLAATLTGEGGPRAADPRAVLAAWRRAGWSASHDVPEDSMLDLARTLGAGRLLVGSVVGMPGRMVINARLLTVPDGEVRAAPSVHGAPDSLPALVERLTGQLLVSAAGELDRSRALANIPLPVLRFYLAGQAAYRHGRYDDAAQQYELALRLDSTFALAALGLAQAGNWFDGEKVARGHTLAWAHRGRLSLRDLSVLTARIGPKYPAPSSWLALLGAQQRLVEVAPDQPEAWYELGDWYFHRGAYAVSVAEARRRAATAFHRAVSLDSSFTAPLAHLVQLAALEGDTASARRLGALYLARDSTGDVADFLRWRVAVALGDSVRLRSLRARFDRMPTSSLERIIGAALLDGVALRDAELAARRLRMRAATPAERANAFLHLYMVVLNGGRPAEAARLLSDDADVVYSFESAAALSVESSLYWDGDTSAARRAVAELERRAREPRPDEVLQLARQFGESCALQEWRLTAGDTGGVAGRHERLRAIAAVPELRRRVYEPRICIAQLEALLARARGLDMTGPLTQLDSLARQGLAGYGEYSLHLLVSQLHESRGDRQSALAALRRRPYVGDGAVMLSTYLREEGRLAALTGDREGAIAAYRHYLALRSTPEPALVPQVNQVRAALAALSER
jgi:DNA-binding SARP family transcriptional activator